METSRDDFSIALRSAFLKKGARQKFSLLALILVSLLFITLDSIESKYLDYLRFAIKDGIYRGSVIATVPEKYSKDFSETLEKHFNTYKENYILKSQLEKLRRKNLELKYLKAENKILLNLLQEQTLSDYKMILSRVMIDKQSPFLKSIIINKGRNFDIKKGMAVVSESILVGRVVEVNYFSSRVLLINDLNSKIPVLIEPDGYQAILSGKGKTKPSLDFLPKSYEMNEDSIVYTSGKDGVLLSGIPIGKININEGSVDVNLIIDPTQLSYVSVILNKGLEKNN